MALPPKINDLVKEIASANQNTVVVVQSGMPVTMPWITDVKAVLQAWYGGNEGGNGIADVVFGAVNPGAKLPLTFPIRNQDNPAYLNMNSDRNRILYGEDIFVGYQYYEMAEKQVLFPFGHGLIYTIFEFDSASLRLREDDDAVVSVDVKNTGQVGGSQVVQVYVQQQNPSVRRPHKELKGFTKVFVNPGSSLKAEVRMSKKYATSWWDEERDAWIQEKDEYVILVGDSSVNTPLKATISVDETCWWNGL